MFDIVSWGQGAIQTYGYLGVFLVSFIATISIYPLPLSLFIFLAGGFLNPLLVALIAGLVSTAGEFLGYGIGFGGQIFLRLQKRKKHKKRLSKIKSMLENKGFWALPLLAFIPIPYHLVGISAGLLKYNKTKFFLGVVMGRLARMLLYSCAGYFGFRLILSFV
ncbi:VTT domain-containing protein [Candidatus Woesearchaeota archaeon]|nr:VTT domain-containing protein [Candidatus Woesearchaeota archaeon]